MSSPVAIISVHKAIGGNPGFRDSAARLFEDLADPVREVTLDFSEVVFVSRGFADELHQVRQELQSSRGLTITVENANEEVMAMLNAVARTQNGQAKPNGTLVPIRIQGTQGLEDLILGM